MKNIEFLLQHIPERGIGKSHPSVQAKVEADLARSILGAFRAGWYRSGAGYMLRYDGKRYQQITKEDLEADISILLEKMDVGSVYIVRSPPTIRKHILRNMHGREFKWQRGVIAFRNGVLDLDADEFYPTHDERFETVTYFDYDYDPEAECIRWKRFLSEVMPDKNAEMIAQEFCGYMFIDRRKIKMEKALYLLGTGGNGKGVFSNVITAVIGGNENTTVYSIEDLTKGHSREYNIAMMNGKIANICSDMGRTDVSGGEYKRLVSGEPMTGRPIYGSPFVADQIPPLIMNLNEMPVSSDQTVGHNRRSLIIPFERTFLAKGVINTSLEYELTEELSGIFNWIMEGRKRFIANRGIFTDSVAVDDAISRSKVDSNSVLQFLAEKGWFAKPRTEIMDPKMPDMVIQRILMRKLYEEYVAFCRDMGLKNPFSQARMGKFLQYEGFVKNKTNQGVVVEYYVPTFTTTETLTNAPF